MLTRRMFNQGAAASAAALLAVKPARAAGDVDFVVRAAPSTAPIAGEDKPPVPVLAYNGQVPGPEIRVRRGSRVRVRYENGLDQPSTIHWHGIRIDNAMDGVPGLTQKPVPPGGSFIYDFAVPDAGTFWYHPHAHTSEQLARGLAGALIVEEDEDPGFAADVTLMLRDWRLTGGGAIDGNFDNMMDMSHAGRLGNWLTVNGRSLPEITVPAGRPVRLRLLNVSNSRVLSIDLERIGARIIALDGMPLEEGQPGLRQTPVAPSQRIDITAEFGAGSSAELVETSGEDFVFSRLTAVETSPAENAVATPKLVPNRPAEPDLASARRHVLDLQGGMMGGPFEARIGNGHTIAGETHATDMPEGKLGPRDLMRHGQFWAFSGVSGMDSNPFFRVERRTHVAVTINNLTAWPHGIHFHGHHFRVLTRGGKPEPGQPWRDTVLLQPDETVEIAFVADNPGKWMIHCHMIEHQISGMMSWFEVI